MRAAAVVQPGGRPTPLYTQLVKLSEAPDGRTTPTSSSESGSFATDAEVETAQSTSELTGIERWRASCRDRQKCVRVAMEDPSSSTCASLIHYTVVTMILVSTFSAVISTCHDIRVEYDHWFELGEEIFTAVFTAEILVRIWTSPSWSSYFCAWSNIIDILATLPWFIETAYKELSKPDGRHKFSSWAGSFRTLRVARLIRIVRIAKVARHSEVVSVVIECLLASSSGIYVLIAFLGAGTVCAATVIFAAEQDVPHGQFTSLPASMWWALTTITTVGYGDMVPTTTMGRIIGAITMVGGTLIVTLSVAVVTSSFTEEYRHRTEVAKVKKACLAKKSSTNNELGEAVHAEAPPNLAIQVIVDKLNHVEQETLSTVMMLKKELEAMQCTSFSNYKSMFANHTSSLFLDSLGDQATSLFRSMKKFAEGMAQKDGESLHAQVSDNELQEDEVAEEPP